MEQSTDAHIHHQDPKVCLQDTPVETVGTESLYVSIWLFDGGRGQGMFLYYVQCTAEPELQGFFFLV